MAEQVVNGKPAVIENPPKEDVQRRMSQVEAAVISLAGSVEKLVKQRELSIEEKAALDKRADKALKDAAARVDDFRKLKVGDIVHYHAHETADFEIEQVPCYAVEYVIKNREGIRLNAVLLTGKVIVPQCTANDFVGMDNSSAENEAAIHTNRGRSRNLAEYRG